MPYPAKTNAELILSAAMRVLEEQGEERVAMRDLSRTLGLSPRAIYRYFPDRKALLEALAKEGFRMLREALVMREGARTGRDALWESIQVYLRFARDHRNLHAMIMRYRPESPGITEAGRTVWDLVVSLVEEVVPGPHAAEMAVALWSLVHGYAQLAEANLFSTDKPATGLEVGFNALIAALQPRPRRPPDETPTSDKH